MQISVTITGDQEIMRRLKVLGKKLLDFEDALGIIGKGLAKYYASTGFTDQGAPYGENWQALAKSTLKYKEKHYSGAPALVRTGKMRDSFYYEASSNQVTIDNHMKYFKYHQSTKARKTNTDTGKLLLPRRPTMGLNTGLKKTIETAIEADIRKKIDGAM